MVILGFPEQEQEEQQEANGQEANQQGANRQEANQQEAAPTQHLQDPYSLEELVQNKFNSPIKYVFKSPDP